MSETFWLQNTIVSECQKAFWSRNAIFSGLMTNEIKNKYPDRWNKMFKKGQMNKYEDVFFRNMLKENNINKSFKYVKISDYNEGKKFYNKIMLNTF